LRPISNLSNGKALVSQLAGGPAIRIAMEMVMGIWMLMEMQMAVSKHYNQQFNKWTISGQDNRIELRIDN